jgi:hypothetical protein
MSTQNSEKPQTTVSARRRLLQIVAVGGTAAVVLPAKWVKPVVDSVIVPAHAAGSVVPASGIFGNRGTLFADSGQGNFLERVADMMIGSAHATAPELCGLEVNANTVCISFVISSPPSRSVTVFVNGESASAPDIASNNTIGTVNCGNLVFTNLIAGSSSLGGNCESSRSDCSTGAFTLLRRMSNTCNPT